MGYHGNYPPIDGQRVRHLREARFLSRPEFAEIAGISLRAVAAVELGEVVVPRPSTVRALAAALGVEVEALTCDDPATAGEAVKDRREVADARTG